MLMKVERSSSVDVKQTESADIRLSCFGVNGNRESRK